MKLIASMNTYNELSRYLQHSIDRLLTFCDEVRVQDDNSTDGTYEWLQEKDRVVVKRNDGVSWREHEGQLHQQLLDFTMEGKPTHIIAIDADEIVMYGKTLRDVIEEDKNFRSFTLNMVEIWSTNPWLVRMDGWWSPHPVGILYKVPPNIAGIMEWQMWDRKMAGGRVPRAVRNDQRARRSRFVGSDVLHLGWANPEERAARYARYKELDDGNYHDKSHLDSIMLPDSAIQLETYPELHANQLPVLS